MVRQLVQEVNWHEAMVEDKGDFGEHQQLLALLDQRTELQCGNSFFFSEVF